MTDPVIPVKFPFNCWEVGKVTWKLFFQTGFREGRLILTSAGEEIVPAMRYYLDKFDIKPLEIGELFDCNVKQSALKIQMADWWTTSSSMTITGRPFDGIICPPNASASYPHDFPTWWGYTSLWNMLDYPAVTVPVKDFKISAEADPRDLTYTPIDTNFFDKITYDMCECSTYSFLSWSIQANFVFQMIQRFLRLSQCACRLSVGNFKMKSSLPSQI